MTGAQNGKVTVIFDMDGVIVDSAQPHYLAWRTMLKRKGIDYSYEEFKTNFGRRTDMQVRRILGDISDEGVAATVREKDILFREIVSENVAAFPGAVELIKSLKAYGGRLAIGSSSPTETVHLIIGTLGIKDDFDTIVCGGEVTESKPSPQIFLLAAKKLSALPERCIVIEDTVVGVTAAKKGGMRAVAVTNTHPRESLSEADLVVDSLKELTVNTLENLLHNTAPAFSPTIGFSLDAIRRAHA